MSRHVRIRSSAGRLRMEVFFLVLGIPLAGGVVLALSGHWDQAPEINVGFSLGTFIAACALDGAGHLRRPAVRLEPGILHRSAERVPGDADGLRRPDHRHLFPAVHAGRARPRQDDAEPPAPVPQHVPAVQLHHAAGADDQQHGHPVGGHGSGDAHHRAAGQRLPHRRQPGGGLEILHPLRRRHRAGPVRHGAAVHGGGKGARVRGRGAAVDAPRHGEGPARPQHHDAGLRLPVHRLRHQGRTGAAAQLAARCPRRGADAGVGGAVGPVAQRGAVCRAALQGADRRRAAKPPRRQPDDGLRPGLGGGVGVPAAPAEGRQAHVRLFVDRAHGADDVRLRHGRADRQLRRAAAHDRALAGQVGHLLRRRATPRRRPAPS